MLASPTGLLAAPKAPCRVSRGGQHSLSAVDENEMQGVAFPLQQGVGGRRREGACAFVQSRPV